MAEDSERLTTENKTAQAGENESAVTSLSDKRIIGTVRVAGETFSGDDEDGVDRLEAKLGELHEDVRRSVVRQLTAQRAIIGFASEEDQTAAIIDGDPTLAASQLGRAKGLHNVVENPVDVNVDAVIDVAQRTLAPAAPAGAAETLPGDTSARTVRGLRGRQANEPERPAAPTDDTL
jgi:hypothetical protein